jgi:hypothetical protein
MIQPTCVDCHHYEPVPPSPEVPSGRCKLKLFALDWNAVICTHFVKFSFRRDK